MMKKNPIVPLVMMFSVILAIIVLAAITHRNGSLTDTAESSESSLPAFSEIIVPSSMPANISISVPAGFTETSSEHYDKYYIKDDASIIITGEELLYGQDDVNAYTDNVLAQYRKTADRFMLLSDEKIKISSQSARLLEFSYAIIAPDKEQELRCLTAVVTKDNYAYLFTCKSHADTFSIYSNHFRKMLESIEILEREKTDPFADQTQPSEPVQSGTQTAPAA
ncbi:MAG: hypothetical protein K5705_09130 [Oscillospiraceae bacterium]|nr:hypothetical protein [Oscillospiraceae bacterium]